MLCPFHFIWSGGWVADVELCNLWMEVLQHFHEIEQTQSTAMINVFYESSTQMFTAITFGYGLLPPSQITWVF
jgi:hypothetical protein